MSSYVVRETNGAYVAVRIRRATQTRRDETRTTATDTQTLASTVCLLCASYDRLGLSIVIHTASAQRRRTRSSGCWSCRRWLPALSTTG